MIRCVCQCVHVLKAINHANNKELLSLCHPQPAAIISLFLLLLIRQFGCRARFGSQPLYTIIYSIVNINNINHLLCLINDAIEDFISFEYLDYFAFNCFKPVKYRRCRATSYAERKISPKTRREKGNFQPRGCM